MAENLIRIGAFDSVEPDRNVVVEDIWDLEEVLAEEAEREAAVKINPAARGRREEGVYGDGHVSGRKRPPGAGTTALPKKVG